MDGGSNGRKALKKRQQMWPTPLAKETNGSAAFKLTDAVEASIGKPMPKMQKRPHKWNQFQKWPTPTTKGYGHASEGMVANLIQKIEDKIISKQEAEQMLSLSKLENHRTWEKKFPTPTAHNAKETNAPSESERNTPTLAAQAGGKLNPMWVEWLMGWPLGWTDLKPLETDKFQKWLDEHGKI
jgi:hypothetical protein